MAATAPRGAMGLLDPHPGRGPGQDGRSPPLGHGRDLSPDAERLPRRPSGPRQQLELHHEAQPSRRAKSPSRCTENGPRQPPVDAIRRGEDYVSAIVPRSYHSVCHRCPPGSPGVDPEPPERFSAESTARLASSPGPHDYGPARSHGPLANSFPYRPCAGLHIALEGWSASMSEGPTNGWTSHYADLRRRALPGGSCGVVPVRALTTVVSPAPG